MTEPRPLSVLLVEDDSDLADLAQLYLQQEGMSATVASDGQRALNQLRVLAPDVIVCDMMMPVLDGFGFLAGYAAMPGEHAPVVAVSAFRPYLEEAKKLGVAAALSKPYDLAHLTRLVRELAEKRHAPTAPEPPPAPHDTNGRRMQVILDLELDRPAPEQELARFMDVVASQFHVPMALISVVTPDRQYWTAGCGIPDDLRGSAGTPIVQSFCTHAVVARSALVVQDANENPFFRENALVTGRGLRFYAGVPLMSRHGHALGTLCVIDFEPHAFTYFDLELLSLFARRVLAAIELREHDRCPEIPECSFPNLHYIDRENHIFSKRALADLIAIEGARAVIGRDRAALVVFATAPERLGEAVQRLKERDLGLLGRLAHARAGIVVRGMTGADAAAAAREVLGPGAVVESVEIQRYVGAFHEALRHAEERLGDAGLT